MQGIYRMSYSRRIPRTLLVPLKPDKYYYRSKRSLIRMVKSASTESRDRFIGIALMSLAENGNTYDVWELLGRFTPRHVHFTNLMKVATSLGDCELVNTLLYLGKVIERDYVIRAARFNHGDLLDLLLNYHSANVPHIEAVAASSMFGLAYVILKRSLQLDYNGPALLRQAIIICYEYGFDREILEHYSNQPGYAVCGCTVILPPWSGTYHSSALETLQYIIDKYPGMDWSSYSASYFTAQSRFTDAQLRNDMYAMLIKAGLMP